MLLFVIVVGGLELWLYLSAFVSFCYIMKEGRKEDNEICVKDI